MRLELPQPLCARCRRPFLPEWPRFKQCPTCREERALVINRWRRRSAKRIERINAAQRVRDRAVVAQRKAAGLCRDCAGPAAPFFRCEVCRRLHTDAKRASREARRAA